MRKILLFVGMVLLGVFLSEAWVFSDQCYPPGTVFREDCPGETVASSSCIDCDSYTFNFSQRCGVSKSEGKNIIWNDHTDLVSFSNKQGQNGALWDCNFPSNRSLDACWPSFLPPVVGSSHWSQTVVNQTCWCIEVCYRQPNGPYQSCESCSDGASDTKSASGSCATGGGGGGPRCDDPDWCASTLG